MAHLSVIPGFGVKLDAPCHQKPLLLPPMQMSFYTKNQTDFSAEVVLGKLGYVGCWDAEMHGTKPEFWTSTKTLKQINSDTVQQSNCTLLCDWLTVAALVLQSTNGMVVESLHVKIVFGLHELNL